jgi:hypothetical protein
MLLLFSKKKKEAKSYLKSVAKQAQWADVATLQPCK